MRKRFGVTGLVLTILLGASAMKAEAAPIQGDFSITGNFLPVIGATGVKTTLGLATALDFINFFGTTATPGVAGQIAVNAASGDFSPLQGAAGLIRDFSFAGLGSANYPLTSLVSFQTFPGHSLSFDLASVAITLQLSNVLVLDGTGIFHMSGFDDTLGSFTFTGNGGVKTFSFSASNTAAVPEPASLLALAVGLLGGGTYLRRRHALKQ